jgi:hypothetical protein
MQGESFWWCVAVPEGVLCSWLLPLPIPPAKCLQNRQSQLLCHPRRPSGKLIALILPDPAQRIQARPAAHAAAEDVQAHYRAGALRQTTHSSRPQQF